MEIIKINGEPDYAQIIDLVNTEWPDEFGKISDREKIDEMRKSHNVDTDTVKYLYQNNQIIGFYRYSLWPREDKDSKQAHTYDVAVLPEFQRQGLGSLLMSDMINECRKNGITKLLSRSFKNNEGSVKLHTKSGFSLHLETDDSFVWVKDL